MANKSGSIESVKGYKESLINGESTINQLREKEGLELIPDGDKFVVGIDYSNGKDLSVEVKI